MGTVKNKPRVIDGGHIFPFISLMILGEIECGAYEPTKLQKIVSDLRPGDVIKLFGGLGTKNTFNIEKVSKLLN